LVLLPLHDILAVQLAARALHNLSSCDDVWFGLYKGMFVSGRGMDCAVVQKSLDSDQTLLDCSAVQQSLASSWKDLCRMTCAMDRRAYRSADFDSIVVADPAAATRSTTAGDDAVLLETLLVGCSDAEMARFFYTCKFGHGWTGIRYLNTFGELLSLKFSKPPLRLKISVQKFANKTRIDFSHMGMQVYRRAIIVCIGSREGFCEAGDAGVGNDPDMRDIAQQGARRLGVAATPLSMLRQALDDEELSGLPLLVFVRSEESLRRSGKPDMSTGGPVMTPLRPSEVFQLLHNTIGSQGRQWRIQACDFGAQPMLGVAAGLHWLHSTFVQV